MSIFRRAGLTLCAIVSALAIGCSQKQSVPQTVAKPKPVVQIIQEEETTITTQIIDIQQAITYYTSSYPVTNPENNKLLCNVPQEKTIVFTYLQIKGGDINTEEVLILRNSSDFIKKYVPVKITCKKIANENASLQDIIKTFTGQNVNIPKNSSAVKIYGVVQSGGIEYLGK